MAYRIFRLIMGVTLGALAIWLIVSGGTGLYNAWQENLDVLGPVLRLVAGLAILAGYWFSLWSDSPVRQGLENIFSVPELLKKLGFTLGLLCIYRVGFHIPLPGLDQEAIAASFSEAGGAFGQMLQLASMFTGGNLQQSTLFGLGIMPYISASIIFQLLTTVVPSLERLQKEGPAGVKKIQEYTRYATVGLCLVQASVWMKYMTDPARNLVYPQYAGSWSVFLLGVVGLTAGTVFLMWLGEQIDEYGIGNGISLLIMAGIVSRLPYAINELMGANFSLAGGVSASSVGPLQIIFLALSFVGVVAGAILITQAQRRIPIQQAKHTRGRRVYGGQRHYMPLRVNHGGVMPIIFASSLMIFPTWVFQWLRSTWPTDVTMSLADAFDRQSYMYWLLFIAMIFFFAYFWTTIQFRPREMADRLRDNGSFIPGLRPGKRTAEYLERVMERITYCGAAFLAIIAVLPMAIATVLNIPFSISAFLGGTGLLITVSVTLDLVQRIEAQLVMRNYGGFLGGSARIKGAYG